MAPRVLVVARLPTEWLEPLQAAGLDIHQAPELTAGYGNVDADVATPLIPAACRGATGAEKSLRCQAWDGW